MARPMQTRLGSIRTAIAIAVALLAAVAFGVALTCGRAPRVATQGLTQAPSQSSPEPASAPSYVGRSACAPCHEREMKLFEGSRHDLAMQPANASTVLGDFSGATFEHFGVKSTFFRRDGKYFVNTEGPDGALADYEIAFTFGVFPLQQYLIAFPGGRYQALSVSWDARPKSDGGQRWFHLYPDEAIPAGDILHWTGPALNWNFMCAECHSTNLRKGWRADELRYDTTYSEIDVSCEACHGPASAHVAWAQSAHANDDASDAIARGLVVNLRSVPIQWVIDPSTGVAKPDRPPDALTEVELCARCHSRRGSITEEYVPGRPLLDTHRLELLDQGLYFPDGQQQDEVYEYGSFLQSRMYMAGVSCGNCHDPHTARIAGAPDNACARCHSPERFATPEHHHHEAGTPGASCVECHMPTRNYMVIDARRDHALRVPRPDLSVKLGTPNACNACHADKNARWASAAIEGWFPAGRWTTPHYGEAFDAARRGLPDADLALAALEADVAQPGIVRATAVELLGACLSSATVPAIGRALADREGQVRTAALHALVLFEPEQRVRLGFPLLSDPLRGVRIEAASALADEAHLFSPEQRRVFDAALAEYRAAQLANADRPEAYSNLGAIAARLGDRETAQQAYEQGLRVGSWFAGSWLNLADLAREKGDDAEAERVLRRGLAATADRAQLHHALGLTLIRQKRVDEALVELKLGLDDAPDDMRLAYVYGVALMSVGRQIEARVVLSDALTQRPADRDLLYALATLNRDLADWPLAHEYAQRLVAATHGDSQAKQLLAEIDAAAVQAPAGGK
jgi:tetratricopeptide (TPR) repeat protein